MTTIHFNYSAHIELWTWLAANPTKPKKNWPGWSRNGGPYFSDVNYCFACQACEDCEDCPIAWLGGGCQLDNSQYRIWEEAKLNRDYATAALYAQIIADIPLRSDINVAVY